MNAKLKLDIKETSSPISLKSPISIEPRKVQFNYDHIDCADFFGGNIVTSAFYAALSISFPQGEAEFIQSVRYFDKQITDPQLREEVQDFAAQEAHHGLQHKKLNQQLESLGYPVHQMVELIGEEVVERRRSWSPNKRLRRTVSAEHFTATMAHQALSASETLNCAPTVFQNLFLWHAIEEVEHKSVTFDVYQTCVGNMHALKWHYLYFACIEFPLQFWLMTRFLLREGGFKVSWKDRREFIRHLFGKQGVYSSVFGLYLAFFKPNFHPWQHDDSNLIGGWQEKLEKFFIGTNKRHQNTIENASSL